MMQGENTALILASKKGHTSIVHFLLDRRAEYQTTNEVRQRGDGYGLVIYKVDDIIIVVMSLWFRLVGRHLFLPLRKGILPLSVNSWTGERTSNTRRR